MLLVREKSFYRIIMRLVIPITLQNVMGILLNMCDTVMLGKLEGNSEEAITAANLANQPFFLYTLFIFGMISGAAVLISQYWGKGDVEAIRSISGIAFIGALSLGTVFTVVCYILAPQVIGIFSKSGNVIELGVAYLRIVLLSYIPAAVTALLCGVMKATEQVKIALISNGAAIIMNIILNYILIFGKLGFPALGIRGAAIATLISRIAELITVLIYVIFMEKQIKLTLKNMFRIRKELVVDFLKFSTPVIANETLWGLGITIHSVILGNLGEEAYAAYSIINVVERICQLATMGFANAAAIIIGKEIGMMRHLSDEGEIMRAKDRVYNYAKTLLTVCTASSAVIAVIIFSLRYRIISFFNISEYTKSVALNLIVIMLICVVMKAFNAPNIVGVIRGGGDTLTALLIDFIPMYALAIPLGILASHVFHLPFHWIYACLLSDEMFKVTLGVIRFRSRKWIKKITR